MFYLSNVDAWLEEILERCSENGLDPQASIFAVFLFSSLDFGYVNFFSKYKKQISSASGENVHLFTPIVHHDQTIPDDEWRRLREHFRQGGIPLPGAPAAVLFKLKKRKAATGFEPNYFAAFQLPEAKGLPALFRDFVNICIERRSNLQAISRDISELLRARNLVTEQITARNLLVEPNWPDILASPQLFISYSHRDADVVDALYGGLKRAGVRLWLDRHELSPGDRFQRGIEQAIGESDALIVLLSEASKSSAWIQFEGTLFYGRNPENRIIPIVLDEAGRQLAAQLPFLHDRLFVDLRDRSRLDEAITRIRESLSNL